MTFWEYTKYILLMIFRPKSLKTMEWRMLRLLNRDRKYHKLPPVRMQEDLRYVARKHSADMAQKDYFDHVNTRAQSPGDRLRLSGVTDVVSGENLAKIGGFPNPTQHAETGLMNSPGHRANILNSLYNTVGIGVIQDRNGVYYFTQNFAKRDVVLFTSVSSKVRSGKHLIIKGSVFSSVNLLFYQLRTSGIEKPQLQSKIAIDGQKFRFHIVVPEPGAYELLIFAGNKGDTQFHLVNKIQFRSYKPFLFF